MFLGAHLCFICWMVLSGAVLAMTAVAFSLPFSSLGAGAWIAATGAGMFACSDLLLGDAIITGRRKGKLVMLLYSPAVFLLALSAFFF